MDPGSAHAPAGVLPGRGELSLAEEVAQILRAPVASGLHSLSAAHLAANEPPDEDAFICGDHPAAKRLPSGEKLTENPGVGRLVSATGALPRVSCQR